MRLTVLALTLRVLKIEADKRRMGLSLKRVSSADYENVDWETVGIDGTSRFLARLWRLADPESNAVAAATDVAHIDRAAHRLIARVDDEFERWSYNTAVAAFMEFTNVLYKDGATDFAVDTLLLLMAPMTPHIAAELWERRHPGAHP